MAPRGNSFQVRWRPSRKADWETCTFSNETDADAAKKLAEARNHLITKDEVYRVVLGIEEEPETVGVISPFVKDIVVDAFKGRDIADSTRKEYVRLGRNMIAPAFDGLRCAEVDRPRYLTFITSLVDKGCKPAYIRKAHAVAHVLFGFAVTEKYMAVNPAAKPVGGKTELPKIKKYDSIFLTHFEADLVRASMPPSWEDFVDTGCGTGMRPGEILELKVSDLFLERNKPYIHVRGTKTDDADRTIFISRKLAKILAARVKGKRKDAYVFGTARGHKWDLRNFRRRIWWPAIAKASRCASHPPKADKSGAIPILAVSTCLCESRLHSRPRPHDLRHSHVGWLIEAAWDFFAIMRRLGHASIQTTFNIYGHRRPDGDTDKLDELDEMAAAERQKTAAKNARDETMGSVTRIYPDTLNGELGRAA
ncbi:hypothetical protein Lfu02_14620 [Longispora fulva]|nr:hypothetical protein Lfu02_14620 [Longispora fulva]